MKKKPHPRPLSHRRREHELTKRTVFFNPYSPSPRGEALTANKNCPKADLCDLGLPDLDGKEVIRRIRERSTVPVLVLSIREDVREKVGALDAGADDYLIKPFHTAELFARLRVLVRHATNVTAETLIQTGPLSINLSSRTVILDNIEIHCTSTEYALLKLLARNIGKSGNPQTDAAGNLGPIK